MRVSRDFAVVLCCFAVSCGSTSYDRTAQRIAEYRFVPLRLPGDEILTPVGGFFSALSGSDVMAYRQEEKYPEFRISIATNRLFEGFVYAPEIEEIRQRTRGGVISVSGARGEATSFSVTSNSIAFQGMRAKCAYPADIREAFAAFNPETQNLEVRPEYCNQVQFLPRASYSRWLRDRQQSHFYARIAAAIITVEKARIVTDERVIRNIGIESGKLSIEGIPVEAKVLNVETNVSTVVLNAAFDRPVVVGFRPLVLRIDIEAGKGSRVVFMEQ